MRKAGKAESGARLALYHALLLGAGFAYFVLSEVLCRSEGPSSLLVEARGADVKGRISLVLYLVGIGGSFVTVWVGVAMYIVVAAIWLVPDRRLERLLRGDAVIG